MITLRTKLIGLSAILLICFCLSLSIYLKTHFAKALTNELLVRGTSFARHIAEISTGAFIEQKYQELEYIASDHVTDEKDIVYILMLDKKNNVLAHSFSDGYPLDLKKVHHVTDGVESSIQKISFGDMLLYDISVPALDNRIGFVRIGISSEPVQMAVNTMTGQVIGATLFLCLVVFCLTLPLIETIIQPVSALTHAAENISDGLWDKEIPIVSNDEIGKLTKSFNKMTKTIKSSQKQLAAQVNFLQVLIDDIPLPVFYKNRDGIMLGCNNAYCDFWGRPKQEVIGQEASSLYKIKDQRLHHSKDEEILEKQTSLSYEHSVVDAKGRQREVLYTKAPYNDEIGNIAGFIAVIHDMTEQRKADRMKNEFVSTVAHEFQTPLATILGFSELIKDGVMPKDEQDKALGTIANKTEELSEMVDELLDLARIETGEGLKVNYEDCNTNEIMATIVDNFRKRTTTHEFILEVPEEGVILKADKVRMGQVMENLLSNAVKYSLPKSVIKVTVNNIGPYCKVQVIDQGIGMTKKQAEKIFERYYRVDTSNTAPSGTGLGLFITKSIIEAHNGQIEADSSPGEGTTVSFQIPISTV